MDRLIRESNPPAGQVASPVPQVWDPTQGAWVRVYGEHHASRAILYGPNGKPISATNRLPVDIGTQLHLDVDLGDVTVEIGEVQQGARGENAEPWEVTFSDPVDVSDRPQRQLGYVRIYGSLAGLAADRPPADEVDIGTTYWSVDTGDVSVSTGTTWRSLGVA